MADISIKGLKKTYPGSTELATNNVSLDVAEGEFMVLLGPSGCGKTTLLRMVAGLDFPDEGSISIGGRDVTYLPPQDRNLSMVFQSYAVFPQPDGPSSTVKLPSAMWSETSSVARSVPPG